MSLKEIVVYDTYFELVGVFREDFTNRGFDIDENGIMFLRGNRYRLNNFEKGRRARAYVCPSHTQIPLRVSTRFEPVDKSFKDSSFKERALEQIELYFWRNPRDN